MDLQSWRMEAFLFLTIIIGHMDVCKSVLEMSLEMPLRCLQKYLIGGSRNVFNLSRSALKMSIKMSMKYLCRFVRNVC